MEKRRWLVFGLLCLTPGVFFTYKYNTWNIRLRPLAALPGKKAILNIIETFISRNGHRTVVYSTQKDIATATVFSSTQKRHSTVLTLTKKRHSTVFLPTRKGQSTVIFQTQKGYPTLYLPTQEEIPSVTMFSSTQKGHSMVSSPTTTVNSTVFSPNPSIKPTVMNNFNGTTLKSSSKPTVMSHFNGPTPNLTIVTAYWNLGKFQKGEGDLMFSTNTYFKWVSTFKYLVNPLVVYTDSKEFKELMETLRFDRLKNTEVYLLNRTELWPFKLINQIKSILDQPGYPKHHPNTVIPEYPAAQHSKFAVVRETIRKKVFKNPYYAWLDIGYFRDVVGRKLEFSLNIPPKFDSNKVSFNRINDVSMNLDPFRIFRNNIVWVGGGMFLGKGEVLLQFEQLYHRAVKYFLDQHLMNSDQQVLYSMYSKKGREALKPNVELQLYIPKGSGNPWFYLGYLCRKEVSVTNS